MKNRDSWIAALLGISLLAASPASAQMVKMPDKTGEFLGYCKTNPGTCVNFIQSVGKVMLERGEKNRKPEICIPKDSGDRNDYDRIMRWIMLRPETHAKPTNAVLADALKGIYPCKAGAAPEKSAAKAEKSEKKAETK